MDMVTVLCLLTALQVKWLKGDKIIKPSKYFQMSRQADTNTLRISEVFPEDEGEYKCVVSNEAGTAEVRAPLKVLGTFFHPFLYSKRSVPVL